MLSVRSGTDLPAGEQKPHPLWSSSRALDPPCTAVHTFQRPLGRLSLPTSLGPPLKLMPCRCQASRSLFLTEYVTAHLRPYCPQLVDYQRFVELMPRALVPLCGYLSTRQGHRTEIAFIDSTSLAVCDNHRMATHKVFAGLARREKTSIGWCFGFKLHRIVNDEGALLAFRLTPGNVDDRQPVMKLAAGLGGQLFGDRGSIS
jgi:hypothetical protein